MARPIIILWISLVHVGDVDLAALLAANLPAVAGDLEAGAIVTIARGRVRVRPLPIVPGD
jgi:predicted nuclease of predicted toxin-antitoxin system